MWEISRTAMCADDVSISLSLPVHIPLPLSIPLPNPEEIHDHGQRDAAICCTDELFVM
jgi:hypothetical protein